MITEKIGKIKKFYYKYKDCLHIGNVKIFGVSSKKSIYDIVIKLIEAFFKKTRPIFGANYPFLVCRFWFGQSGFFNLADETRD
jgi:hypothetical protein